MMMSIKCSERPVLQTKIPQLFFQMRILTQLNQYTLMEHRILAINGMLHTQKCSQAQQPFGLTILLYVHNYLQTNTATVNTCPFSDAEREQLLRGCKTLRDKAMMEFLYSTAVRVSELARLNIEDIRWSTKDLIVYGKGRKERTVYINERTNMYLQEYLQSRTDSNPALFVSLRKPNDRLSKSGIEDMIRRTGRQFGIQAFTN